MREDLCSKLLPAGRATLRRGVAVAMVVGLLSAGRASEVQAPSEPSLGQLAPPRARIVARGRTRRGPSSSA